MYSLAFKNIIKFAYTSALFISNVKRKINIAKINVVTSIMINTP